MAVVDAIEKRKINRKCLSRLAFFVLAVFLLGAIFVTGYELGQKGKSIGIGPKNVTNIEVGMPSGLNFSLFWEAWNKLKDKSVAPTDTQKMIYGSISGMLSSVDDPYTVFFTPADNQRFKEDIGGSFDGIGVEIIMKNQLPTVVAPLPDSPAEKKGIKSGDIILQVDGVSTATVGLNELIDKIRGKAGDKVTIQVGRAGSDQPINFEIVRATITVKSVEWSTKKVGDKTIMYVKVRQFGDDTSSLFASFVDQVVANKPDGVIIDLRNNPGGYLTSAVDLSSYFLDGGTVVSEKGKDGESQDYKTTRSARLAGVKTVILVNNGSASASEIFSGALQDRKAATLIGEQTFGKGCVQELIDLSDGSAVKITVANWFTPAGRSITNNGITPDIVIANDDTTTTDTQLSRALDWFSAGK